MGISEIIFLSSFGLIFYSTIIYVFMLNIFKNKNYEINEDYLPSITLIICAYNEEKNIENKLQNVKELDYPFEKIQVILVDDGSNDNTVNIAKGFNYVNIISLERSGKTAAQNKAVNIAENEILVFSDANSIYQPNAIKKLVRNFADKRVGVVCGELHYKEDRSEESLYWKYEISIKKAESRMVGYLVQMVAYMLYVGKHTYLYL